MSQDPQMAVEILNWVMKTISTVLLPIYLYHRSADKKDRDELKSDIKSIRKAVNNIHVQLAEEKGRREFINEVWTDVPKMKKDLDHLYSLKRKGEL